MRPTKLTENVIETIQEVLNEWHNALVCTDKELFFLLNDRLPVDERISYRSFQRYKAHALAQEQEEPKDETQMMTLSDWEINHGMTVETKIALLQKHREEEAKVEEATGRNALYDELFRLWRRAIIKQKNQLMDKMLEGEKGWTRFRWIFQRKFIDFSEVYMKELEDKRMRRWDKYVNSVGLDTRMYYGL